MATVTPEQMSALRALADDLDGIVLMVSSRDGDATARQHQRASAVRAALAAIASPPASDPPGLVELVAALKAAANRRKGRPHGVARVSAEYEEALAYEALLAYPLPASPQAETTKGDR